MQGSRFLAVAHPAGTRAEAEALVAAERRLHHDATHVCSAWRLGTAGGEVRSDDDGEPSGTAGRPILGAIEHAGLTFVLVTVTRWYGGVKLGTGGLARAYGGAAAGALRAAPAAVRHEVSLIEAEFAHELTGAVMHAVARAGARVVAMEYAEGVRLTAEVRRSRAGELLLLLGEQTRGAVRVRTR